MLKLDIPEGLREDIARERHPNRTVAVFVNGSLMCPDQPDDEGDYLLAPATVEFHGNVRAQDLVTITDFVSFRYVHQHGHWHRL